MGRRPAKKVLRKPRSYSSVVIVAVDAYRNFRIASSLRVCSTVLPFFATVRS